MKVWKLLAFAALMAGYSATSGAATIRYTFVGAEFADGGTISGFFDWDTSLDDLHPAYEGSSLNFEISVSGGNETAFPAFTYTDEIEGPMRSGGVTFVDPFTYYILGVGDLTGPSDRVFYFIPDVTSGTLGVDLNIFLYLSPGNSIEIIDVAGFNARGMSGRSGQLQGVFIPEPAPHLLLVGLAAALLFRRAKTKSPACL